MPIVLQYLHNDEQCSIILLSQDGKAICTIKYSIQACTEGSLTDEEEKMKVTLPSTKYTRSYTQYCMHIPYNAYCMQHNIP